MAGTHSSIPGSPARIAAVAGSTFTQLVRMRLFLVPAAFALCFLGLQFIPFHDTLGIEFRGVQQLQLLKDIGTGCMLVVGLLFCVSSTALLIPKDVEERILYTILSKPVPRFDYLAGKVLGVLLLLGLLLLGMDALVCLLLWVREGSMQQELVTALSARGLGAAEAEPYLTALREAASPAGMQAGIASMFLGFAVLTTLTLLISCFTSGTIVSIIFALGAYLIGSLQDTLFRVLSPVGHGMSAGMQVAQHAVAGVLPDFSLFFAAEPASTPPGLLWRLALLAAGYMLLHLATATWIFNRKEF
ncbi:MAG: hypothetical protein MR894_03365 [Akkermansia muciniphila]|nr:hypothetical protein [Akkermansia muciniphila]